MAEENTENPETNPNKRRGKKKRKNFLSNAKKYAKKGQMGRGTQMPEELYQYFVGILDSMKKGIDTPEERRALVDNVLDRTKGIELDIIGNQLGCRVIELLLPMSSADDLERFMGVLSEDLRKLCSDNFTSHVVETVLKVACDRATERLQSDDDEEEEVPQKKPKLEKEVEYNEKHIEVCNAFTLKISKYALNNLEDFVWDTYSNHILRRVLKCLSGIILVPGEKPKVNMFLDTPSEPKKGIPPHQKSIKYKTTPSEYKAIVLEFAGRLTAWPQFKDLAFQSITSGLLQVLLFAVKSVDKNVTKDLLKKLLNESFAPDDWASANPGDETKDDKKDTEAARSGPPLPPVFSSESSVRLLEAALFVAKKKMYTQIYAKCFINRLPQLSTMPMLNFTVQRLFDNCDVKEEFEPMFQEISDKFGSILVSGNTGVLVAVAKACLRLKAQQTQFLNSLQSSLSCEESEQQVHFPQCCLRLLPLSRIPAEDLDKDYFINVHGSVVLQTILHFQRPTKPVAALLELPPTQLVRVLCDAKGSHVADALFTAPYAGVKARDKLLWKLKGHYQQLALNQFGSRALETMFARLPPEQKLRVMAELADKSSLLLATKSGRLVADNLRLPLYTSDPERWRASLGHAGNCQLLFKDIVDVKQE